MNLGAGDFKKQVVFRKPTITQNNEGGEVKTFADTIVTWAAVKDWTQKRVLEANNPALVDTRIIYIRYASNRAQIDKDWRVVIDGKEHVIQSKPLIIESGLKVFEISCKAK